MKISHSTIGQPCSFVTSPLEMYQNILSHKKCNSRYKKVDFFFIHFPWISIFVYVDSLDQSFILERSVVCFRLSISSHENVDSNNKEEGAQTFYMFF